MGNCKKERGCYLLDKHTGDCKLNVYARNGIFGPPITQDQRKEALRLRCGTSLARYDGQTSCLECHTTYGSEYAHLQRQKDAWQEYALELERKT